MWKRVGIETWRNILCILIRGRKIKDLSWCENPVGVICGKNCCELPFSFFWDLGKPLFKFSHRHPEWAWESLCCLWCLAAGILGRDASRAERQLCVLWWTSGAMCICLDGRSCHPVHDLTSLNSLSFFSSLPLQDRLHLPATWSEWKGTAMPSM